MQRRNGGGGKLLALSLSILGGTSATALYSAHAPVPVLSHYDHPFTRTSLSFLSGVADILQDLTVPPPVLGLYGAITIARANKPDDDYDHSEYSSIRAFRSRPIQQAHTDTESANEMMLAPISGEILSHGAVGAGGMLVGSGISMGIRDVLGAEERDPISARGVRVTEEDIDGYTDYSIRYVHIRPRSGDSLYTIAPTDVSHMQVRTLPGTIGTFSEFGKTVPERLVYNGTWDGGLLSLVALSGPGRRHTRNQKIDTDNDNSIIARRTAVTPAPQPASLIVVFECADDGFVSLVKNGDYIAAGQPLAKVSSIKQASSSNNSNSNRELEAYKEKRRTAVGKERGRVRRSW